MTQTEIRLLLRTVEIALADAIETADAFIEDRTKKPLLVEFVKAEREQLGLLIPRVKSAIKKLE